MNEREARETLAAELEKLRACSYSELVERLLGRPEAWEVTGASGVRYQIEVEGLWDSRPGESLRVVASIDDGGWRAFKPVTDDFIVAPDGSFVGQ